MIEVERVSGKITVGNVSRVFGGIGSPAASLMQRMIY
jgi:hypothetical protein